jgi:acetyl-CoA/propionyl-CoA carboxylase biotin carboxyl carrier protein
VFDTVLVANRGEIARRVMRTCRELGVRTVAVYSDADADAPHVADADTAVRVGPPPAAASYLDVEAVVRAALDTGAQAVHPGYGFLSENAAFAEAVTAAGLAWVGPSPEAIRLMGDKAAAKARMREAGVPVVPGVDATEMDDDELVAACDEVGFPLLLKAVAGGGGKGMRPVHRPEDLREAVAAARREAAGAFGDDRMIVERLVARPRHVEIQVFGDTGGHVIHLFERDCSIQRRHQKIVEETPSPAVDDDLRARMGAAAVDAARAVDYVGAGTVEFIVDADDPDEFFFLEMNTRLQVEHPVTEMVTGVDLVEWQLRVAAGEPLPATQEDLAQDGHAIEVRVYAEDPAAGFLPQTGTVARFDVPAGPGRRVDAGIVDGTIVPRHYDPMLAKLVVHAADRPAAVARLRQLLADTVLHGVRTNLGHLADVAAHPVFADGDLDTGFLDRYLPDWSPAPATAPQLAAVAALLAHHGAPPTPGDPTSPWRRLGPWRPGPAGGTPVRLADGDAVHDGRVRGRADRLAVTVDGAVHDVQLDHDPDERGRLTATVDGTVCPVVLTVDGDQVWAHVDGRTLRLDHLPATHHADAAAMAGAGALASPMPGAVLEVRVAEGDHVEAGQVLLLVEAMKMEHPVSAPGDGTVVAVHVTAGDAVEAGAPLVEYTPDDHEEA